MRALIWTEWWTNPSVFGLHGGLVSVQLSDLHLCVRFIIIRHPDSLRPWESRIRTFHSQYSVDTSVKENVYLKAYLDDLKLQDDNFYV